MKHLNVYTREHILAVTRRRNEELKVGEQVCCIADPADWESGLSKSQARFVLLGIPEDIGVRANYGRGGSHTAWKPALDSFLNQQSNPFLNGNEVLVLGHIHTEDLMKQAETIDTKDAEGMDRLRALVTEVDQRVAPVIRAIVSAGKIPLIVGGGHNNAYGNIRGAAEAKGEAINVINCDPHTDFRPLEGRHSGNGFSYAFSENFLNRYSVCFMHEQYNTNTVLREFAAQPSRLYFSSYEDVFVKESLSYAKALKQNISFVKEKPCGVEIDLDAITNVPSSAKTSSGISPVQARQYVYQCGRQLQALYLHIAEGAPVLAHLKADNKTGKLIAYLLSDFIKGIIDRNVEF